MRFNKTVRTIGDLLPNPGQEEIRRLLQFFRADADYAYRLGGSVYREFIDRAVTIGCSARDWNYISLDSRVHMLMPGFYPCIPGWHCDDFWRPTGDQPDLESLPEMQHVAVVFGETAMTRFIRESLELPYPPKGNGNLYARYHRMIEDLYFTDEGSMPRALPVYPGEVISFGPRDFHRGDAATKQGWRVFIRATFSDHWEPKNEIRTQTQVYLPEPFTGW